MGPLRSGTMRARRSDAAARTARAGGLIAAHTLLKMPAAFAGALLRRPFVTLLNTMTDPTLPLTALEYDEWGHPDRPGVVPLWSRLTPHGQIAAARCGRRDRSGKCRTSVARSRFPIPLAFPFFPLPDHLPLLPPSRGPSVPPLVSSILLPVIRNSNVYGSGRERRRRSLRAVRQPDAHSSSARLKEASDTAACAGIRPSS